MCADLRPLADQGVEAMLLDLDDTLTMTRQAMIDSIASVAASLWPDITSEVHRGFGERFHADPGGFFRRYTRGEITIADNRRGRFEETRTHFGLAPADYEAFDAGYDGGFVAALRVYDDALALLRRLDAASVPVGIVTNASSQLTAVKLQRLGLEEHFAVIVTRDTFGYGKPDQRVFQHACRSIGTRPEHTAYVGDELDVDALGAAAAGLTAVWLDRRGQYDGGDVGVPVVTTLDDIQW